MAGGEGRKHLPRSSTHRKKTMPRQRFHFPQRGRHSPTTLTIPTASEAQYHLPKAVTQASYRCFQDLSSLNSSLSPAPRECGYVI